MQKLEKRVERKKEESVESEKEGLGKHEIHKEGEVEEGELIEDWSDVTPGKESRSPNTLNYGQVKILTPSRFSSLLEVDEKGDSINLIEIEEILSIEEEKIEEEEEGNARAEKVEDEKKEVAEGKPDERKGEEEKEEGNIAEGSLIQGIAGVQNTQEHWSELASA